MSDSLEELREKLTSRQYTVACEGGTEPPFDNEYWDHKEDGVYVDIVSGVPLFSSSAKFDSGTGWPSFDREIKDNVAFSTDYKIGYPRTEEHCATCGGHLGHVFDDGPRNTTGKRHCINGAALKFIPENEE